MGSYSFKLPDLGEGTVESEIVAWRVNAGDPVGADQPLVDMMTDKATIEITAPVSGTLVSVAGEPGDDIKVGAELAVFATDGEGGDTSQPAPAARKPLTSPAIRRLARESNIDLTQVQGTGTNGRIIRADIDALLKQTGTPSPDNLAATLDGTSEIKLIGVRRKIAEQMALSASRIPHFSYVEEVDVTELERLRQHLNGERQAHQAELTYLPFFMQALVKVVKEFPQCNAHFDDERQVITQYEPVHIGIAVQTGDGLMVPVIRHVEDLDLWQCAHELRQVADKARNGNANREELTGSTITITSLGALGGIVSTPIINYPEVAIIGINRTQKRQVFENNGVTTRLMMNISSSFDHRIVDGHDAARAIQALKRYLEFPATIFLMG
jgi:2-oxoisovalerate dehydrogenase E2 component (dihydrolipoyl transacylase)